MKLGLITYRADEIHLYTYLSILGYCFVGKSWQIKDKKHTIHGSCIVVLSFIWKDICLVGEEVLSKSIEGIWESHGNTYKSGMLQLFKCVNPESLANPMREKVLGQIQEFSGKHVPTWRIIPVSKWLVTPIISHLAHLEGEQPYLGDLLHGMGWSSKQGSNVRIYPENWVEWGHQ